MKLYELNDLIAAVCPIDGINSDGEIHFKPDATDEQKSQAQTLMDANLAEIGNDSPADLLRQQLANLDSAYPITQRNLRELTLALAQVIEQLTGLPAAENRGVQVVTAVETQAQPLRDQLKALERA